MKNPEVFNKYFIYDEESPTKLRRRKSGNVAGHDNGKQFTVTTRIKNDYYSWTIPRVLFEIYNGFEPPKHFYVGFLDDNRTNLSRRNLILKAITNKSTVAHVDLKSILASGVVSGVSA